MSDDYVLYSYYYLPVLTKEYATAEELKEHFGCIPKGEMFEDRMANAVRLTRLNRSKILAGTDPDIGRLFREIEDTKGLRIEEVERSW